MKLFVFIVFSLLISPVFSQELHPDFHTLEIEVQDQILQSDRTQVIAFEDWKTDEQTKKTIFKAIEVEGLDVFNVWGDTILGGDYTELGSDYWLTTFEVYLVDGKAAVFSATTVNKAVYYGDDYCDYDYYQAHEQWNQECVEKNSGELREKFFINTQGADLWLPSNDLANFFFNDGRDH